MRPADDAELAEVLSAGSDAIGFPLAAGQVECFVAYIRLIEKWNATYNLTAIRDPRAMATHHILDCLAAAAALIARRGRRAEHLLDVGSGAGLPGIVIAIVAPERQILCVDSVGKKAAFITQVAGALGLKNLAVRHARVESLHAQRFDVIACRAFASLHVFVRETRRLLSEEG
ncbi:MAG: 16S rRNA (guanine(527)-N(7))-methyltransferase RsmG, partial [Caldimonas sp.]